MTWLVCNDIFQTQAPTLIVVGCGGTGGFVAEGLCRLMVGRECRITLVDHDVVEEHNLRRQNFYVGDIGKFKSKVLAERLATRFDRPIDYSITPWTVLEDRQEGWHVFSPGQIIIGCVDNPMARRAIGLFVSRPTWGQWWIDAGNGRDYGQVLIGNRDPTTLTGTFLLGPDLVYGLPLPTVQQPTLLEPAPEAAPVDCAQAVAEGDQSSTINHLMAGLVLEYVRRLVDGTLSWMATYLDTASGTVTSVPITPETVARMTGVKVKRLVVQSDKQRPTICRQCGRVHR